MGCLFSFYFGKLNSELTDPSVCPNLNANVSCTKSQGHWIISNVRPGQCIFKGLFKKPDTQIAHFDAAVCGRIGYISQTNVIRWVLFLFSFLLLSQCYQQCWTHCFIFSFLKEDTAVYQNIPSPQLLQTHFLNNTLVIWMLSYFSCGDF